MFLLRSLRRRQPVNLLRHCGPKKNDSDRGPAYHTCRSVVVQLAGFSNTRARHRPNRLRRPAIGILGHRSWPSVGLLVLSITRGIQRSIPFLLQRVHQHHALQGRELVTRIDGHVPSVSGRNCWRDYGQLQCLLIWYMRGAAISCAHSSLFVRSLLMGRYCCRYRSTNRMSSEFPGPVCWRDCGQRQPCASLHSSPRLSCPEAAASPPSHVHGGRGYLGNKNTCFAQ